MSLRHEREVMLPLFRDIPEKIVEKTRVPKSGGYTRLSPSSLEYAEKLPSLEVSEQEMEASLKGTLGHHLDNIFVGLMREAREEASRTKLMRVDKMAKEQLDEYKSSVLFFKKSSRSKSRPRIEGDVFSAGEVEEYWHSTDMREFEDQIFEAHRDIAQEAIPLMVETDTRLDVYQEESARYNVDFGFDKFQVNARYDYLIHNPETGEIKIVDFKTGKKPKYSRQQVFLYSVLANHHINVLNKNIRNKRDFSHIDHIADSSNVSFYYRYIEKNNYLGSRFRYSDQSIESGDWPAAWEDFMHVSGLYKKNINEIRKTKKSRDKAFVMPFVPEGEVQQVPKQKGLIYFQGDVS